MERIPIKIDSKFRFVLLASHRAEQMMRGAPAKIDLPRKKITRVAMEEVIEDLVTWDYGRPEPAAPTEAEAEPASAEPEASTEDAASVAES